MTQHGSTSAEVSGLQQADNLPDEFHRAGAEIPQSLFGRDEIAQFEADDSHAGAVIGKLLAAFFVILVAMMAAVNLWMSDKSAQTLATGEASPRHDEAADELHFRGQFTTEIPSSTPRNPAGE